MKLKLMLEVERSRNFVAITPSLCVQVQIPVSVNSAHSFRSFHRL